MRFSGHSRPRKSKTRAFEESNPGSRPKSRQNGRFALTHDAEIQLPMKGTRCYDDSSEKRPMEHRASESAVQTEWGDLRITARPAEIAP
jgi:hypothetical protein